MRFLFVLFALAGRTAAMLEVAILCAVVCAQCQTRELPLTVFDCERMRLFAKWSPTDSGMHYSCQLCG